jgi:hypothetical protein
VQNNYVEMVHTRMGSSLICATLVRTLPEDTDEGCLHRTEATYGRPNVSQFNDCLQSNDSREMCTETPDVRTQTSRTAYE